MPNERFRIIPPEGDGPKKRFEIIPPASETPKKRFEIIQPKKKFQILSEGASTEQSEKTWFKQENENDCGPAMLLNMLAELGITTATSIAEVRQQVNQLRQERGANPLAENAWLFSDDIGEYLSKKAGLSVEEYVCFKDVQQEVDEAIRTNLEQEPYSAVYTTSGRHFTCVVNKEGEEMLLDSFQNGPQSIDANQRDERIKQNVFSTRNDVPDRVGVVRISRAPGYRTIAL